MEFRSLWNTIERDLASGDPTPWLVLSLVAIVLLGLRWISTRRDVDEWLDELGLNDNDADVERAGS